MRQGIRLVTQWHRSFWDECKCSLDYVPIFSLSNPALLGCVRISWCMIPLEEQSFGTHYWYILLPNLLWGIEFWLITGFPLCFLRCIFLINKNIYKGWQYCILVFEKKVTKKIECNHSQTKHSIYIHLLMRAWPQTSVWISCMGKVDLKLDLSKGNCAILPWIQCLQRETFIFLVVDNQRCWENLISNNIMWMSCLNMSQSAELFFFLMNKGVKLLS